MLRFETVFSPHENAKLAFSSFPGPKSVFEKFCFGDKLVWVVSLKVRNKAIRFQISTGAVLMEPSVRDVR